MTRQTTFTLKFGIVFCTILISLASGVSATGPSEAVTTTGTILYPPTKVTYYIPVVWNDYNQWYSSDVGTYSYNGTYDAQMHAEQHDSTVKLDVLMGMLNNTGTWVQDHQANGIQLTGRNLTIEAEVSNIAVSTSATWLRIAVVACVNLLTPFHDPINGANWSQVFMEFDWYWHSGTVAGDGGNFRFVKVAQFDPGTGYHHLSLNFTQTFIQNYGQSTYDSGTLWYVTASTIELSNANATIAVQPAYVWEG